MPDKHFHTKKHDVWLPYRFSAGPVFERFFEGLKAGKILGNRCPRCERVLVPARTFCPRCYVDMGQWVEVSQEGRLVTWTMSTEPFFGMRTDLPYVAGLIHLDGTNCNFMHLLGGFETMDIEAVRERLKGSVRVRAVWREEREGDMLDIKYFEAAD
ncbi:MAG: Zn-ribbon domain-containing OB-fold protein [Deltaproteobacteria bacterium]|nr:Zn-ribbon domain-containing OB-fold protein [Deltaproteobacteria bacterium]MBW1949282.1 Zn-ribbon domain-containing OB-fold protein [Deltaproteobacteria bacterium]MBW2007716.1 Zn-ribbon domain-containing OB-fold protein [Deltaproteobacteria bacterium]MBW2347258.1 Zn-ribbon domain-containing OB-fold protein [Deltaproteobacteria bacterium]